MSSLKIAEKITMLRHEKGITQEQLANYLKVTKASVSKWETKQCYPDILLLPQIAVFFDVTVDELLGYEAKLSKEQIKKIHEDLSLDFANLPLDEAMDKSKKLAYNYYSCYPLLLQIALLWINHFMLGDTKEKQEEILREAEDLCQHIVDGCHNVAIGSDAQIIIALINLQLGKAQEVIEILEPLGDQKQLKSQIDNILFQAYHMAGEEETAQNYNEIMIYTHLLNLVSNSIGRIALNMEDKDFCNETIRRTLGVMELYNLEKLHPNVSLQFYYQCAVYYASHGNKEESLAYLKKFTYVSVEFLESGIALRGDEYFTRIDNWFEDFALGTSMPRHEKTILDGVINSMANPAFAALAEEEEYKSLVRYLEEKRK